MIDQFGREWKQNEEGWWTPDPQVNAALLEAADQILAEWTEKYGYKKGDQE